MNNIFSIIRLITIILAVLLIILLRNNTYIIPLVVLFMVFQEVGKYLIIQLNVWKKNYFCIGLKRFYMTGLFQEILISLVLFTVSLIGIYRLNTVHIYNAIIAITYILVMVLLDSRKHIFIISKNYLLHKHLFQIIQWELELLDKVYVYPHKIEFVKGGKKLKAAFDEPSDSAEEIVRFIKPIIGRKLVVKKEDIFYDFV